jgi:multidrug efflux system membrane fusion protein
MTNHFRRLPLSGFIVCAVLLSGCDGQENQQQHPQAPQVSVHIVKSAPLAVTTELPGRTDAFRVAEVRPQVSGIILRRNFTEGSDVKAGDSLYQIDPATYQAAYDNAKGELAKAQAAANIAHLTVKRYLPLVGTSMSASRSMTRPWQRLSRQMPASSPPKRALKARVSTLPIPK